MTADMRLAQHQSPLQRRSGKTSSTSSTRRRGVPPARAAATSSSRSSVVTMLCGALFYLNSGALQPIFDAEFDRGMAIAMRRTRTSRPRRWRRMRGFGVAHAAGGVFIFMPLAIFGVGVDDMAGRASSSTRSRRFARRWSSPRMRIAPRMLDRRRQRDPGAVSRSGAARRPIPAVARRRPIPRSRHGVTAAPRDRRPRGSSSRSGSRCSSPSASR